MFRKIWNYILHIEDVLTSEDYEQDLLDGAHHAMEAAEKVMARVQEEKNELKDRIDELTREIAEKDALIEAARARAERSYKLAETIKKELDGGSANQ